MADIQDISLKISADPSGFVSGMQQAQESARKFNETIVGVKEPLDQVDAAAKATGGSIREFLTAFAQGVVSGAREELKSYEEAMKQTGQSASGTAPQIKGMAEAMAYLRGTSETASADIKVAADVFKQLQAAGLTFGRDISSAAAALDKLSASGAISAERAEQLKTTFTNLGNAGIKTAEELSRLQSTFNAVAVAEGEAFGPNATRNIETHKSSITELVAKYYLVQQAIQAVVGAFREVGELLKEGREYTAVSSAFGDLQTKAGLVASETLPALSEALRGTVSNLDIMKEANQAALLGLDPSKLIEMAGAAEKLGAAVGRDASQAFNDLVVGVGRASPRILDNLGIIVSTEDAYKKFAESIGTTSDKLNDAGKKAAVQEAAYDAINKKVSELSEVTPGAGIAFEKLATAIENATNDFSAMLNKSAALIGFFTTLTEKVEQFRRGLSFLSGSDFQSELDKQALAIENYQKKLQEAANPGYFSQLQNGIVKTVTGFDSNDFAKKQLESLITDAKDRFALIQELGHTTTTTVSETGQTLEELRKRFTDTGDKSKEAAKAAKEAWMDFHNELLHFKNNFNAGQDLLADFPIIGTNQKDITKEFDKLQDGIGRSMDLFSTLFHAAIDDGGASLTDTLIRAAEDFGIELAAQMATAFAGENFANLLAGIGKDGGFGKSIAGMFVGEGSSLGNLTSLSTTSAIAAAAVAAAGLLVGGYGYSRFQNSGKTAGDAAQAGATTYFAGDPTGISQLYFLASSTVFGANSEKAQEREARARGIADFLGDDRTFNSINGPQYVASKYTSSTKPLGGQATALANPIAQIAAGGNDKLASDLANSFADATANAKNFNEVLINTRSLLAKSGESADQAKSDLTQLFKDGKVSVEEFTSGISQLNLIASNDLVGPNSVADAIGVVTDSLADPGTKIQAIGLAFNEMAQQGLDSSSEIHDYLAANFSPDIVAAFDAIEAAGIGSFDAIANATPDQVAAIANAFSSFLNVATDATQEATQSTNEFTSASQEAGDAGSNAFRQVGDSAKYAQKNIEAATASANKFKEASSGLA